MSSSKNVLILMYKLIVYSKKYDISVQLWGRTEQYTIYIEKDDVELYSYGSSELLQTLEVVISWLDRVNKK